MERPSMHQFTLARREFQVNAPRAAPDFGNETLWVGQVFDDVGGDNQVVAAVGNGHRQRISLDDRSARKLHRPIAVQTVGERVLLHDEISSSEGAMASSYIDDEIGGANFNSP
jgi:hypothetical protein